MVAYSKLRPADILFPFWRHNRPAAFDVDVITLLQNFTLHQVHNTPGLALNVGVQRKLTAHLANCLSRGIEFISILV